MADPPLRGRAKLKQGAIIPHFATPNLWKSAGCPSSEVLEQRRVYRHRIPYATNGSWQEIMHVLAGPDRTRDVALAKHGAENFLFRVRRASAGDKARVNAKLLILQRRLRCDRQQQ